ncbi:hypothetical protein GEV27_01880 [Aeromicrobium sp. S22]|uniref:universal stress protein n=1 Tax=Aeromicrobium sp. S22 TaxID=2662029 RepID=UPI00129E499F|nr:universal stress protein [Aeromicrobium sp. S22]MRK00261.1 hypothetical protein [Aeromicrobium sp. S22]
MSKPVTVGILDKQPNVLSYAIRAAATGDSVLRVVHAAGFPAQSADFYAGMELLDDLRAAGQGVLDDARELVEHEAPDLTAEYVLTTETPLHALKHEAAQARMLVLGSDQVSWFDRLLRSRVSGHLALHAACPVVVVPTLPSAEDLGRRVVLALDGDASDEGPVRFALEQAAARRGPLNVVHALAAGVPPSEVGRLRAEVSGVLEDASAAYPDTPIFTSFSVGEVGHAIIHEARQAGLVVVGRPSGPARMFSRPVATQVLREAHCAVAIVPPTYKGP